MLIGYGSLFFEAEVLTAMWMCGRLGAIPSDI
jgi:hypothetical protein